MSSELELAGGMGVLVLTPAEPAPMPPAPALPVGGPAETPMPKVTAR